MQVKDVIAFLNEWAPEPVAEHYDNVGLQIGRPGTEVTGILVALEATEGVVDEACQLQANLIVTHHPLIFRPLKWCC